jgi:hypothetical protein
MKEGPAMVRAGDVLRALFSLAWKCGVAIMAVSWIAAMFASLSVPPDVDRPNPSPWAASSSPQGRETHVRMEVPSRGLESNYVLEDEDGDEVVRVTYARGGFVIVRLGSSFPVQPGLSASRNGEYNFAVHHRGVSYRLKLRENEPSGLTVTDALHRITWGFGFTKDGDFVDDPSIAY